MAAREYVGPGGARWKLSEPLSPEMTKQVAKGDLVPVHGDAPDVEPGDKSLVVTHGSEALTADRVGVHRPAPGTRPGDGATGTEWATYAVGLGLLATQAATMTVPQLIEWVEEHEAALAEGEAAPVPVVDADSPDAVVPHPTSGAPKVERPAAGAKVGEWRAYAIALGMAPDEAKDATKAACVEYADRVEAAAAPSEPVSGGSPEEAGE